MPDRITMRAVAATSTLALVLAYGLSTAAASRVVKIASQITIRSQGLTFSGVVTSSNAACRGARKVTLYLKPSQALGSTTTNSSGKWKITASGSAGITLGHFYAKAKARSEGTAGTIYLCKSAASKTIPYKP